MRFSILFLTFLALGVAAVVGSTESTEVAAEAAPAAAPVLKYPDFVQGGADEKMATFLEWLRLHSAMLTDGVMLVKDPESEEFVLMFQNDVNNNQLLFSIPLSCSIFETNPQLLPETRELVQKFVSEFYIPGSTPYDIGVVKLALIITNERKNEKSFFKPFWDVLPAKWNIPLFASAEENAKFEYDGMTDLGGRVYSPALGVFQRLKSMELFQKYVEPFTIEDFSWALATALRAVEWGNDDRVLVPLLTTMRHSPYGTHKSVYTTKLSSTGEDGKPSEINIPYSFAVISDRQFVRGELATFFYGPVENPRLILQFAAVMVDNPYDYIVLNLPNHADAEVQKQLQRMSRTEYVGVDGVIATRFVKAVNLYFFGTSEVTKAAYEKIFHYLQLNFQLFSANMEEDSRIISDATISLTTRLTAGFRLATKRHMNAIANFVQARVQEIEQGKLEHFESTVRQSGGFPSRVINFVEVQSEAKP